MAKQPSHLSKSKFKKNDRARKKGVYGEDAGGPRVLPHYIWKSGYNVPLLNLTGNGLTVLKIAII